MNVVGPDMEGMGSQMGNQMGSQMGNQMGITVATTTAAARTTGSIRAAGTMGTVDRQQEAAEFKEKRVEIENEEDEEEMWRRVSEGERVKL